MICEVWDWPTDSKLREEEREPKCGEAFCDNCGCCLHCDPACAYCEETYGGCRWVFYERAPEGINDDAP